MNKWYRRLEIKTHEVPERRTDKTNKRETPLPSVTPETVRLACDEMTRHLMTGHGMTEEQAKKQAYQSLFGGEQRQEQIREAARLYRERGWVQIYSGYLGASIYLVKGESVKTPDPAIPRYTESEVAALGGLNPDEVKTLHECKAIFGGAIQAPDQAKVLPQVSIAGTRRRVKPLD
ncbi:MAG: hypothetical protein HZA02_05230 [Nitrospinae bacterium]|nr:hypothetical protein [Nitrospinota bacterium]